MLRRCQRDSRLRLCCGGCRIVVVGCLRRCLCGSGCCCRGGDGGIGCQRSLVGSGRLGGVGDGDGSRVVILLCADGCSLGEGGGGSRSGSDSIGMLGGRGGILCYLCRGCQGGGTGIVGHGGEVGGMGVGGVGGRCCCCGIVGLCRLGSGQRQGCLGGGRYGGGIVGVGL